MQLKQLVSLLSYVRAEGPLDREIKGITCDSRRATSDTLFVAIPGHQSDGHNFILNAVERGAVAVICERNGFIPKTVTTIKVADSREALARVAEVFYHHPSAKLKLIGITGTNGKTTVAFLVKQILETHGTRTGLLGTIRYEIGDRVIPAQRTTPESLDIQGMLAQMVQARCQACVMEVSSHALEQKRVARLQFDVVLFTNLTQDHLDYHQTMESYYQAKKKLFTAGPDSAKRRTAVINIDDAYGRRLARETDAEVIMRYGIDQTAQLRATQIQLGHHLTDMVMETPAGTFPCRLPLVGRHNVYNALAAVGAGLALNVEPAVIRRALESAAPVPGRLETVSQGQPFEVLVDYAHTDDALRNVLTTLRELTPRRLLLAFGCGGNRDTGKRAKMGQVAAELADYTIITSDNPRKESAFAIAIQIEQGFRCVRHDRYHVELDRRRAIDELICLAQPGDTVLIAGKGHETYQEYEDTLVPFDDRVFAQETLENLGYERPVSDVPQF